jgi:hypothetical protein
MPPKLRAGARVSCRHGDENLLGFVERVNLRTIRVLFDGEDKPRSIKKKPGFYKVIAGGKKVVAKVTKKPTKPKPTNPQSSSVVGRRSKASTYPPILGRLMKVVDGTFNRHSRNFRPDERAYCFLYLGDQLR